MIRRLALAAGCVALSTIAFSAKAGAQTVELDMSGTTAPSCSITSPVAGVLRIATNPANRAVMTTNPTEATGASTGKFTLNCSGAADATVGIPEPQNAASRSPNYGARLNGITPNFAVKDGSAQTGSIASPISNRVVEVDAFVNNGGTALPSGTYAYKVSVTVVPK